jgi:hypothetical protein
MRYLLIQTEAASARAKPCAQRTCRYGRCPLRVLRKRGAWRRLLGIQLQPLTSVPVREMCATCPSHGGALGDAATTSNHVARKRAGTAMRATRPS